MSHGGSFENSFRHFLPWAYSSRANCYYVIISFQSVSYEVQSTSNQEREEGISEV
jgi:hypothetical protein